MVERAAAAADSPAFCDLVLRDCEQSKRHLLSAVDHGHVALDVRHDTHDGDDAALSVQFPRHPACRPIGRSREGAPLARRRADVDDGNRVGRSNYIDRQFNAHRIVL